MELNDLKNKIDFLERKLIEGASKKATLEERRDEYIEKNKLIGQEKELLNSVKILLQKTSDFAREQAKNQIEDLTSNCLSYIFASDSRFEIELSEAYGKTSAEFYIVDNIDGIENKTKPIESRGGGLVDIISIALRISFIELMKPKIEGPLILDEPAKHVSEEYIFNFAGFLKQTSEMFDRQIIMITHNSHLAALSTKSYRVNKVSGTSIIDELKE